LWRLHPPKHQFSVAFWRIFFLKTGNLRQNIPFSKNCVAIWRFFAQKIKSLVGGYLHEHAQTCQELRKSGISGAVGVKAHES